MKQLTKNSTNPMESSILRKTEGLYPVKQIRAQNKLPFFLTLLYLFMEFGRPQDAVPQLRVLHLPGISVFILALSLLLSRKRIDWSVKQTQLFFFLLILMAFHVPLAKNNFWAFHTLKSMLMSFIAYLGIIHFVDSYERLKTLLNTWLLIHIFLAVYGILSGGRGIGGFIQDENDFSMVLNMVTPLPLFLSQFERNKKKKMLYLGILGLFIIANIASFSRGGFLGIVAVATYFFLKTSRKTTSLVVIGLVIFSVLQFAPDKYITEMRTIEKGTSNSTAEDRIYMWTIGWEMFLSNPIIGVGQGNFPYRFREYEISSGNAEGSHGRSRAGRAAHSVYFTVLPELGILGLILFFVQIKQSRKDIQMIRKISFNHKQESHRIRKLDFLALSFEASLLTYLVSGVFVSIFYYPSFWVLMGFIVALRRVKNEINSPVLSPAYQ